MGRLPSHIFVVRHGNRLDAADKQWHLTSPTPYDPPLTYSGLLQARQVGNQITSILEQAKLEEEVRNGETRRKRFKVVIHSSPFLRCVQTSIGISSGLAQIPADSIYRSSDIIIPPYTPPNVQSVEHKTALLRLDSFLGEWLCPEYFEMITPPPGPALMMGGAKAELLRREDYSMYSEFIEPPPPKLSSSLWQGSPTASPTARPQLVSSESDPILSISSLAPALPVMPERKKGYIPPRPIHASPTTGKIPEGFVAHSRDACVTVDYQWDSMREPLDFGDGGKYGEEWTAMHKRFRQGLRKLINWYSITDGAEDMVTTFAANNSNDEKTTTPEDEDVDTVLVLVSHGAGCNALMGAITHQPVLMDVAIASLTMAVEKPGVNYQELLTAAKQKSPETDFVAVDQLYQMRMSATTEHLQSTSSTPVSARSGRSASVTNGRPSTGSRGRTSTLSGTGGPVMSPFIPNDTFDIVGSRSTSASASLGHFLKRETSQRSLRSSVTSSPNININNTNNNNNNTSPSPKFGAINSNGTSNSNGGGNGFLNANGGGSRGRSPSTGPIITNLWAPAPSSLRLMHDSFEDEDEDEDTFGSLLPDFDNARFRPEIQDKINAAVAAAAPAAPATATSIMLGDNFPISSPSFPKSPMFAGPIRIETNFGSDTIPEEVPIVQLGGGLGGLWGQPPPPSDAEMFRDMSHTKRRWTVNEPA